MFVRLWCAAMLWPALVAASSLDIIKQLSFDADMVDHIHAHRQLPIAKRSLQGSSSKCGFYALSHAMHAFDSHAPSGQALFETAETNGWLWSSDGSSLPRNLFLTMQVHGYRGEYGWGARGGTIKYLKQKLNEGYSILLAVRGTDDAGIPRHPGMFHVGGHWVALEGFVTIEGVEYLIVKDSSNHSAEPTYVDRKLEGSSLWPLKDFESAWSFWTYVTVKPD